MAYQKCFMVYLPVVQSEELCSKCPDRQQKPSANMSSAPSTHLYLEHKAVTADHQWNKRKWKITCRFLIKTYVCIQSDINPSKHIEIHFPLNVLNLTALF